MDNGPEIGKIAADFLARNLTKIVEFGTSVLSGAKSELELRLKTAYSTYLKNAGEQYGHAKSFFIRSVPTNIYTFYIPMRVTSGEVSLSKVGFEDIVSFTKRAVVTASAAPESRFFFDISFWTPCAARNAYQCLLNSAVSKGRTRRSMTRSKRI